MDVTGSLGKATRWSKGSFTCRERVHRRGSFILGRRGAVKDVNDWIEWGRSGALNSQVGFIRNSFTYAEFIVLSPLALSLTQQPRHRRPISGVGGGQVESSDIDDSWVAATAIDGEKEEVVKRDPSCALLSTRVLLLHFVLACCLIYEVPVHANTIQPHHHPKQPTNRGQTQQKNHWIFVNLYFRVHWSESITQWLGGTGSKQHSRRVVCLLVPRSKSVQI